MNSLVNYARKVEDEMYKTASSRVSNFPFSLSTKVVVSDSYLNLLEAKLVAEADHLFIAPFNSC